MKIKKLLAIVFIVVALSFSAQPVRFVLKDGDSVVLILDSANDDLTNEFIKKNETMVFNTMISLYIKCLISSEKIFILILPDLKNPFFIT